jgi:hypothetical protein
MLMRCRQVSGRLDYVPRALDVPSPQNVSQYYRFRVIGYKFQVFDSYLVLEKPDNAYEWEVRNLHDLLENSCGRQP